MMSICKIKFVFFKHSAIKKHKTFFHPTSGVTDFQIYLAISHASLIHISCCDC